MTEALAARAYQALEEGMDPEFPVSVVSMGLITLKKLGISP